MINIDDRLLDGVDENELYLLCQIARHFGKELEAWPGVERLMTLTGWSKNKVLKIRKQIVAKKLAKKTARKNKNGSDATPLYHLITPFMGVYISADKMKQAEQTLGVQKMNPGVQELNPEKLKIQQSLGVQKMNPGVHKMNGEGSIIEPEVLTNEVLTIATTPNARGNSKNEFSEIEDSACGPLKKSSAKKSSPESQGDALTPETAAKRDAFIAAQLASDDIPDLTGSGVGAGIPEKLVFSDPDRLAKIEETLTYYKDNFVGQSEWAQIRRALLAKDGELEDCSPTVIAAGLKANDSCFTSGLGFRKIILGFARKQLEIDREALASSNNKTNGKSRAANGSGSVLSDADTLAGAESFYHRNVGNAADAW